MTVEATADIDRDCYHCGNQVPAGASWSITLDDRARPLCCPGCEAVAHAIVDGGLASYYRFRTELPERPDERQAVKAETWAVFDDPGLQRQFVHPEADGGRVHATLAVDGITCAACAWLIEHRLNALEGVDSSAVNLTHHRVRVGWDPQRIKLSRLLAEMAAIGYQAQPYEPDEAQSRLQREERMNVRRLIVAAVGMAQVMMFSIPIYVSAPGEISDDFLALFHWLSFALATPVVFFSALPFFRNAARDLRTRVLGMDVPVSIAIGGAYLASGYAVLSGTGEVYFDSVAMFTCFLLFGRYVEARARRRSGHSGNAMSGALPLSAIRLTDGGEERILPASELAPGDRVLVKPGHGVPADGVIEDGESSLDESMLTGEYLPVTRRPGETVTGGSQNIESPLVVRVTHAGRETRVAGIVDLTDRAFASRPRLAQMAARMSHLFVLRLLLVTACVSTVWWFIDPSRMLWVTLSVLVVTCPCALALATPTALTAGHGQLRRRGVLVTRANAIEALSQLDRVILDKTGTLTTGRMALVETRPLGDLDEARARVLAAALEASSEHPIARAFHPHRDATVRARNVVSRTGQGLEGEIAGRPWRLGKPAFAAPTQAPSPPGEGQWLLLAEAGEPRAWFALHDHLREEAAATVTALQALGLQVELLSGDTPEAVGRLAARLGIATWRASASPEDKLERIQALQAGGEKVAMVGDGINDVPVLAGADVAIAMNGATDLARTSADAVLLSPRLTRIVEAIEISRATRRIMRQNMIWSVCYNVSALPLAAIGIVPPWVAALGMSASSLVVVGNALRLNRFRSAVTPFVPTPRLVNA
ncbi:heavy metal translocating P-type ATPase [Halomonas heilongjiangensis]|uniref:Copper-translocating P-type ATPase n=1 Tax=Halomonas heilongjiangensis TaxID=1387883 RepID=A0A2N7TPM0_9GAMM|nr:heavy metal translocating P-type ATPase [Halomonas heilongjiangensis]PMR70048.1 copper-translocating P-type ATPase [Halomonas heilongjiangensis]PXX94412.1 ATPase P [Halomonas heilongjiangensis]